MNYLKKPMMVAEFKEAMSEMTGLPETDDRIQQAARNFDKAGSTAEQMTI